MQEKKRRNDEGFLIMNSFYINLFVTDYCNYNCRYCYEKGNKQRYNLSLKTADNVINFISYSIKEEQKLIINFHGGEPLLRFDTIKYIIQNVRTKIPNESIFGITTNGSLLTDDIIDYLAKNMKYRLSLSMDGNEYTQNYNRIQSSYHISFDTLLRYAEILRDKSNNLVIRMTYDRYNIAELFNNIKFFIDKGFKRIISEADFISKEWRNEDFDEIYAQFLKVKKYIYHKGLNDVTIHPVNDDFICLSKCDSGHDYYSIDCNGFIYPCTMVMNDEKHCMGDVINGINNNICSFIDEINEHNIDDCNSCVHKQHCISCRCYLINYASTGSYYSPNLVMCNLMNVKHRLALS